LLPSTFEIVVRFIFRVSKRALACCTGWCQELPWLHSEVPYYLHQSMTTA